MREMLKKPKPKKKMKKVIRRLFNKFPNSYRPYRFWWLWIAVAFVKTWSYTDLRIARHLYLSR